MDIILVHEPAIPGANHATAILSLLLITNIACPFFCLLGHTPLSGAPCQNTVWASDMNAYIMILPNNAGRTQIRLSLEV
jgi:hypothetical protein